MSNITVKPNQTLMDLAVQYYGNQLAVFALIEDNPNITTLLPNSVNDSPYVDFNIHFPVTPGTVLSIRDADDLRKNEILLNLQNDVTSHAYDLYETEVGGYLVDELFLPMVDENGGFLVD